ncbi:MAG TPA: SCO family protein [Candidatus Polarisedimenticolaceae bacterium]|nr:SCO family protein [Candidatus Polarisedimenticolaceae bacterium]
MRAVVLLFVLAVVPAALAQDRSDPVPKALEGVGVDEKRDAALPLQLLFKDERGRDVTLGSYFKPGRPVILTLNYYRCPMLCTLELNGLVDGMKNLAWSPGDEFDVVTVSIDPREMPPLAAAKRVEYLSALGRPSAEAGWHFLTGSSSSIEALAQAVGFRYQYDAGTDQYGHAAAIFLLTPEGRVSRYLYGVRFDAPTLKMGLLEASRGKIGSAVDRFLLYCYHYDVESGRYVLAAVTLMRAAGALTVLVLGSVVGSFWLRERARGRAA